MYTARTQDELARIALGALVTRSNLSDVAQGSVIDTLAQSMGALAADIEQRLALVRDAFDFRNATGAELDARLLELPPNSVERLAATAATGLVSVTFNGALASDLILETGTSFTSSTNPELIYSTFEEITILAGNTRAELEVVSSIEGSLGNCNAQAIDTILQADPLIISVENTSAFVNGSDEETDSALKRRALLYLQSLARAQAPALEFAALSYTGQPERLSLASIYEPLDIRGYSELYIDDGTGTLGNRTRAGAIYNGTVPASGITELYHDAPATDPVVPLRSVVTPTGTVFIPLDADKYTSIPERGVIYIDPSAYFTGQQWSLGSYEVYTGPIANIQRLIEGDPSNPNQSPAWRAAGTRVRVLPPSITRVSFDVQITPENGYDIEAIQTASESAINDLMAGLRIGQPLYIAEIIETLMGLDGVLNTRVYQAGSGTQQTPQVLDDIYPPPRQVIRLNQLNIIPVIEET